MKKAFIFSLLCWVGGLAPVSAQGPKQIAKINRTLWPYAIDSRPSFDFASKMEMLVFIQVFQGYQNLSGEDSLRKMLGLEKVSVSSVRTWQEQTKTRLLANFGALTGPFPQDFISLPKPLTWTGLQQRAEQLNQLLPASLKPWHAEAKTFYERYIYEQMRLAALFPRVTSEILPLQESEMTGFEPSDRQFLLTFDDGPTAPNGHTDQLLATLKQQHRQGIFFILGDMFQARLKATSASKLHDLYGSQRVGSHGKVHKPHQRYPDWHQSLSASLELIDSIFPEKKPARYFRPPYGQRNQEMITYLDGRRSRVMLWNIDSQDWNAKISSREVADRVVTLMLLWRRGILLFHDIHPKANEALPLIWQKLDKGGVQWLSPDQL
jgi:peptidoglycan/xylan/chitin deacetylase (PgdA/CDA1 family)